MHQKLFVVIPAITGLALVAVVLFLQRPATEARVASNGPQLATLAGMGAVTSSTVDAHQKHAAEGNRQLHADFPQLVQLYQSKDLSREEKLQIAHSARLLLRDARGQKLMIAAMLSVTEPQLAEAAYKLVRDADLSDIALLEGLIAQDALQSPLVSRRVVDLIADANAHDRDRYSPVIDRYLAQAALEPNPYLRRAAASGRIWYLARHQPHNLIGLSDYVMDSAPIIREEMYSLIESRIENQSVNSVSGLTVALTAALSAENLKMPDAERMRVLALLRSLKNS